jgi:hypothetical protein
MNSVLKKLMPKPEEGQQIAYPSAAVDMLPERGKLRHHTQKNYLIIASDIRSVERVREEVEDRAMPYRRRNARRGDRRRWVSESQ